MEDFAFKYCKIPKENAELWAYFTRWYFRIFNMVMASFRWDLPESCSPRELEKSIFYNGAGLIFQDRNNLRWFTLPFMTGGLLNMYDVPIVRIAYANTGYQQSCTYKNSVVVYGNYAHVPDCIAAVQYAEQLATLDQAIVANADAQRTPYILRGTKRQEGWLKELFRKIMRNERALYIDNDVDPQAISVLRTDAPQAFLSLQELKDRTWNECLNYFGIQGGNIWKKERLVANEVNMPQGQTVMERAARLDCRRQAVYQAYNLGLEIDVDYNGNETGDIYGSLYNDDRGNVPGGDGGNGMGTVPER